MNTTRRVAQEIILLIILVGVALGLGLAGCDQQKPPEAPLVDDGPNAGLSNAELVSLAITNMKALKSYHFEFKGGLPSMDVRMSSNLSITGDVQLYGKGARWRVRDEGGGLAGGVGFAILDVGAGIDGIRATGGGWWESYDGGKTWDEPPSGDTRLSFLLLLLDCRWGNLFKEGAATEEPAFCEGLAHRLDFQDGTPRLEKVGDVVTRHLVGVVGDPTAQESGQGLTTLTVNIWVSTDITPTLRQMRVEGSTQVYENVVEEVNAMAISPDGKWLATAHGWGGVDETIRLYDLNAPGGPQRTLTNPKAFWPYSLAFRSVAFSPDSSLLAATSRVVTDKSMEGVYLWDLTQPNAAPMTRTLPADVYSVLFQPGGNMLAAQAQHAIYLWDPRDAGATPTVLAVPENTKLEGMAFSPDGQALAAVTYDRDSTDSSVLIFDVSNPAQTPIQLPDKDAEGKVAFSPDGQLLAVAAEGQINVWNLAQPRAPVATLSGAGGQYAPVAFSPDGKFLAVQSNYNQVAVWDRGRLPAPGATARPVVTLDGGEVRIVSIAFSPDGQRLAAATDAGSVLVWMAAQALDPQRSAAAQPQLFREEEVLIHKPFTLTWTWSRFNEDFGVIGPPPADQIRQP